MDPNRIRHNLHARGREAPIVWSDLTGSTQDDAIAAAAAGAAHGALFGAERQTHGRGRRGRRWISAAHGLTFSLIVRGPASVPAPWPILATAVGVIQAVERATGVALDIKWPNDLVAGARKVGGVLAETRTGVVVVGVGLNVNTAPQISDGPPTAALADLQGSPVDRSDLLVELCDQILTAVDAPAHHRAAIRRAWRRRSAVLGRPVVVRDRSWHITGHVEGFGPAGELQLRTAGGELRTIVAGEVSLRVAPPGPA